MSRFANTRTSGRQAQPFTRRTALIATFVALVALVVLAAMALLAVPLLSESPDATEVSQRLKDRGMPIGETKAYTAENDPNELLGRPGQYTSKIMFKDTRLNPDPIASEFDVQNGGSIEVFENEDDAIKRAEYLEAVTQSFSPFNEYAYREGTVLLRLSHRLTPDQAAQYEAALKEAV